MGAIENMESQESTLLHAQHLFGRNGYTCNTFINSQDVSRSHATIYWSDGDWYLQDHSRNGTLVNGEFIRKAVVKLKKGVHIQFGSATTTKWEMTNCEPPSSYLRSASQKEKVLVLNSCQALPDEQHPEVIFYKADENTWVGETSEKAFSLVRGERFWFQNEEWEFVENEMLQETIDYGRTLENAWFKFCISPDEEDVQLKLNADGHEYDLGSRTHNVMLLTLARKRLADADNGFTTADQGWMLTEDLEKRVGKELGQEVDAYYLNVQIFRVRKMMMELKPIGHLFAGMIERRPGALRFAFPQLKIMKENECLGAIMSDT